MDEIWKPVTGYEGLYDVSSIGRVWSRRNKVVLNPSDNNRGYLQIGLCKNGKRNTFKIHRLVAQAFIPNPNNLPEVNHINENKTDNRVENLEWCTHAYNTGYGNRTQKQKEKCTNGKLSIPVCQYSLDGQFITEYPSMQEAERLTNICQSNISYVCSGKRKKAGGFIWKYKSL